MTDSDKIKAIEDMGIDLDQDCPSDYGFFESKICFSNDDCIICWIKALEDKP